MSNGTVFEILISKLSQGEVESVEQTSAVPTKGLKGDKQFDKPKSGPGRDLTLIEFEAVEAVNSEFEFESPLTTKECRRNIVTKNVSLNSWIGKKFYVGNILCRGDRLCNPCNHLESMTGKPLLTALANRGGLRADILTEGIIKTGDPIFLKE